MNIDKYTHIYIYTYVKNNSNSNNNHHNHPQKTWVDKCPVCRYIGWRLSPQELMFGCPLAGDRRHSAGQVWPVDTGWKLGLTGTSRVHQKKVGVHGGAIGGVHQQEFRFHQSVICAARRLMQPAKRVKNTQHWVESAGMGYCRVCKHVDCTG